MIVLPNICLEIEENIALAELYSPIIAMTIRRKNPMRRNAGSISRSMRTLNISVNDFIFL